MELATIFPDYDDSWLRGNISQHGILAPIIVDQDGRILDGHHRQAIAADLGIDCPTRSVFCADDDAREEIAVSANWGGRDMTKEQRDEVVTRLRKRGWTQHRVARVLHIHRSTVARSTRASAPVERVEGRDGKTRPSRKASDSEIECRRKHVARLWADGYRRHEIGQAGGFSNGTLAQDLAVLGISTSRPLGFRTRTDAPEPFSWRDDEPAAKPKPAKPKPVAKLPELPELPPEPRYLISPVVRQTRVWASMIDDDDWVRVLAFCADEAVEAGDDAWRAEMTTNVRAVLDAYGSMAQLLDDAAYRDQVKRFDRRRDAMIERKPQLRALKSLA